MTQQQQHILIVEHQEPVVKALLPVLRQWGYKVSFCFDPVEAIRLLTEQQIDLMLCDAHMPMLSADKLLLRVKRDNPQIKCCLILGGGKDDPVLKKSIKVGNVSGLVQKPIQFERLSHVLSTMA